ncbi:hypothetical protein [Hydrogenophaga intermedia]|uniref:hypothetical protein n=1 Tax=Hydrogenophaga intermedia TaxID=65786 RepID=UPI00204372F0|nr:hypothetical protein [Hydrogenophaga intermedia]MCM3565928.1 hypothetical protein [Hydrogenophaga intermedia]
MGPGFLPALQSLGLSSGATSAAGNGATIVGPGGGAWTVNLGGSGVAFQGQSNPYLLLGVGVALLGAVWLLSRK